MTTRLVFPRQPSQLEGMSMADMEFLLRQAISIVGHSGSAPPGMIVFPQGTSHDIDSSYPDYIDGVVISSEAIA